jgi:hypothetical protein
MNTEEIKYNYYLEVQEDGNLYAVTEYSSGLSSQWEVTATIEIENVLYFIKV